ncbi:MAG: hypothetical protein IT371_31775 [Deltaproteobacteria bacterium]|nr:hypothetical protein [Deltaproteobacteria bacterium]
MGAHTAAQVCSRDGGPGTPKDKVVVAPSDAGIGGYWGATQAKEGANGPDEVGFAAAAEVVYAPRNGAETDRFALAYVATNGELWARIFDGASAAFTGSPVKLNYYSSIPPWVRHLGRDDVCTGVSSPDGQCAWFTWYEANDQSVNWRAIASNGALGTAWSMAGKYPSGDAAKYSLDGYTWVRTKLLAWISTDNRNVHAVVLAQDGITFLSPVLTLQSFTGGNVWRAHQTAVAWNGVEKNWLVTWTEFDTRGSPSQGKQWARVKSRIVGYDASLGPIRDLYSCGASDACTGAMVPRNAVPVWASASAGKKPPKHDAGTSPADGGISSQYSVGCFCSGVWMASSPFSTNTDRFRVHHYGRHARLDGWGAVGSTSYGNPSFGQYAPISQADFYYVNVRTPFQLVEGSGTQKRLVQDSVEYRDQQNVSAYGWPQALRSAPSMAATLLTTQQGNLLVLTILDSRSGGCPGPN